MARKKTIKGKSKDSSEFGNFINQLLLNPKVLPIILTFACLGVLFVLIRMKGIEQDYKLNEIVKNTKLKRNENKELKAKRAKYLSISELKSIAKKNNLKEPDERHIIIIP